MNATGFSKSPEKGDNPRFLNHIIVPYFVASIVLHTYINNIPYIVSTTSEGVRPTQDTASAMSDISHPRDRRRLHLPDSMTTRDQIDPKRPDDFFGDIYAPSRRKDFPST